MIISKNIPVSIYWNACTYTLSKEMCSITIGKKQPCYSLRTFGNELSIQKQLILYIIKSVKYVEVYNLLYL